MHPPAEPADFYTGIVVDAYAALRSVTFDATPYRDFVRTSGEPALELGCGDGGPFLTLAAEGVDVEGVDSSADMLAQGARHAAERGIRIVTHHQRMERLDLPRRFRSIYLAGPTFNLLPDDATAAAALARIAVHLAPGGSVLVPLWTPQPTAPDAIGIVRSAVDDDGATLRYVVLGEDVDDEARTRRTHVRYEREVAGEVEREERDWIIHWHTRVGLQALAADAGLAVVHVDETAPGESVALLRHAGRAAVRRARDR